MSCAVNFEAQSLPFARLSVVVISTIRNATASWRWQTSLDCYEVEFSKEDTKFQNHGSSSLRVFVCIPHDLPKLKGNFQATWTLVGSQAKTDHITDKSIRLGNCSSRNFQDQMSPPSSYNGNTLALARPDLELPIFCSLLIFCSFAAGHSNRFIHMKISTTTQPGAKI